MIDINQLKVQDTFVFQLQDAAEQPLFDGDTPLMCEVHGPGSRRYVQASAKRQGKLMAQLQREKPTAQAADQSRRVQAEFLADITERLDVAVPGENGQLLEGRDKFLAVYLEPAVGYLAEQVARKVADWANFSKGSATS